MKLDDGRLTFVAQQEVTALDAIHKAVLGKAACAGRVTEGVGTCISIHAPTWGATPARAPARLTRRYFNPRTHVGCDRGHIPTSDADGDFNPRTHVGCDLPASVCPHRLPISIHAPTWGATVRLSGTRFVQSFQSTHPRGVRHEQIQNLTEIIKFQSTHPRGVRRLMMPLM